MIDRFGGAIRYDLQAELQVNILDYFDGSRSWFEFYEFLERLPSWGHYKSALAMDEEWAEMILSASDAGEDVAPAADPDQISPLHYTPEIGYLALIADRLLAVRSAIFAAQSENGHEQPIEHLPRPKTAMDRARERRVIGELLEIEQHIFGGGLQVNLE